MSNDKQIDGGIEAMVESLIRVRRTAGVLRGITKTETRAENDLVMITGLAEIIISTMKDIAVLMYAVEMECERFEEDKGPEALRAALELRKTLANVQRYIRPPTEEADGALYIEDHRECEPGCIMGQSLHKMRPADDLSSGSKES